MTLADGPDDKLPIRMLGDRLLVQLTEPRASDVEESGSSSRRPRRGLPPLVGRGRRARAPRPTWSPGTASCSTPRTATRWTSAASELRDPARARRARGRVPQAGGLPDRPVPVSCARGLVPHPQAPPQQPPPPPTAPPTAAAATAADGGYGGEQPPQPACAAGRRTRCEPALLLRPGWPPQRWCRRSPRTVLVGHHRRVSVTVGCRTVTAAGGCGLAAAAAGRRGRLGGGRAARQAPGVCLQARR